METQQTGLQTMNFGAALQELNKLQEVHQWNADKAALGEKKAIELLNEIAVNGMTPELDAKANDFIARCNVRVKELETNRKPFTQVFDMVRGEFTRLEKMIDVKAKDSNIAKLQSIRDQYAAEQQRLKKLEAERKAQELAKANEVIEVKTFILKSLMDFYYKHLESKKAGYKAKFDKITLPVIESEFKWFEEYSSFEMTLNAFAAFNCSIGTLYLSPDEYSKLFTEVCNAKIPELQQTYVAEMLALKAAIIELFQSKRNQLNEAKRLADEQAARDAEKARIEAEQRTASAARQAELKAQQESADAKQREADALAAKEREQEAERQRLEAAKAKAEADAKLEADKKALEAAAAGETAMQLFDQLADQAPEAKVKEGYNLVITSPAAYATLFTEWFTKEGIGMESAKLAKALDFLTKWAVKRALKSDKDMVKSPYITYDPVYKAVTTK
jgi:hypothetical protein